MKVVQVQLLVGQLKQRTDCEIQAGAIFESRDCNASAVLRERGRPALVIDSARCAGLKLLPLLCERLCVPRLGERCPSCSR